MQQRALTIPRSRLTAHAGKEEKKGPKNGHASNGRMKPLSPEAAQNMINGRGAAREIESRRRVLIRTIKDAMSAQAVDQSTRDRVKRKIYVCINSQKRVPDGVISEAFACADGGKGESLRGALKSWNELKSLTEANEAMFDKARRFSPNAA